ncbi:MAG: 30S ribosome-binding factor RbfA [bacterium]|jgi:ribosome-binding factor A
MQSKRPERVSGLLKEEIGQLIQRGLKDPRIGFVTITEIVLSRDLRHAKVFFSSYGDEEAKLRSLEGLRSALGFIRGELGRRLDLRFIPELDFRIDNSVEYAFHIEEVLHQMKKESREE